MRKLAGGVFLAAMLLLSGPGEASGWPKTDLIMVSSAVLLVPRDTLPDDVEISDYEAGTSWFSRDKGYHFSISAVGAGGVYAVGRTLGLNRWQSALASSLLMGAVGIWREIGTTDRTNLISVENVSRRDLVWDGVGIAVGISLADLLMKRE